MSSYEWDGVSAVPLVADAYRSGRSSSGGGGGRGSRRGGSSASAGSGGGEALHPALQWALDNPRMCAGIALGATAGAGALVWLLHALGLVPLGSRRSSGRPAPLHTAAAPRRRRKRATAAAGAGTATGAASASDGLASSTASLGSETEQDDAREASPVTPVGFRNVGNSCYLNALLQALSSSAPFLAYLEHLRSMALQLSMLPRSASDPAVAGASMHMSCLDFVVSLLALVSPQPSASPVSAAAATASLNPGQFLALLKSEAHGKFAHFNQEDSHELWNVLMDILDRKARVTHARWAEAVQRAQEKQQRKSGSEVQAAQMPPSVPVGESLETLLEPSHTGGAIPPAAAALALHKSKQEDEHKGPADDDAADASTAETDFDSPVSEEDTMLSGMHSSGEQPPCMRRVGSCSSASSAASSTTPFTASPSAAAAASFDPLAFPGDPFQGLQADLLVCQSCHTSSRAGVRHTPFNSLTLNFPHGANAGEPLRLEDMLGAFTRAELISDVRCETCNWNERLKLLQREQRAVAAQPTKGAKKSRYLKLLDELVQDAMRRVVLMQPNTGQMLQALDRNKAQQQQKTVADANGHATSAASSSSSSPSSSTADASPAADFLSQLPRTDALLSPLLPTPDVWSRTQQLLADLDPFGPSPLPRTAPDFLRSILRSDVRCNFKKRTLLSRLPRAMCFHLARLQSYQKIGQFVAFPLRIALDPYTSEWGAQAETTHMPLSMEGARNRANFMAQQQAWAERRSAGARLPTKFGYGGDEAEAQSNGSGAAFAPQHVYELDAVVVHLGGSMGGHYVAYRRQVQPVAVPRRRTPAVSSHSDSNVYFSPVGSANSNGSAASGASPVLAAPVSSASGSSLLSLDASSSPLGLSSAAPGPDDGAPAMPAITWWRMSDESRQQVSVAEVMAAQAYLLIYKASERATQ